MKPGLVLVGQPWAHRVAAQVSDLCDHTEHLFARVMLYRWTFFVNWSAIVPAQWLAHMRAPVNFHCTDLRMNPMRGGAPIENLLLRGYTETMMSAHVMTPQVDAGPVYGVRGPISLAGSKEDILERFIAPISELIRWIVETEPKPVPQQGTPVIFKRLPKAEYDAFWRART